MLADLWPTYILRIRTPRLTLRLPDESELVALAEVAAGGVHAPHERPFLTPWTEGRPEDRARAVLQSHWEELSAWAPTSWALGLGVFESGTRPIGMVTLRARDLRVVREVTTSSWLGLAHHGKGLGTEARAGVLTLAFDHLGATDATSEVFPDNHASQGVSRKLGYVSDGISKDARGDDVLVSDRLRLTTTRWAELEHPIVTVMVSRRRTACSSADRGQAIADGLDALIREAMKAPRKPARDQGGDDDPPLAGRNVRVARLWHEMARL